MVKSEAEYVAVNVRTYGTVTRVPRENNQRLKKVSALLMVAIALCACIGVATYNITTSPEYEILSAPTTAAPPTATTAATAATTAADLFKTVEHKVEQDLVKAGLIPAPKKTAPAKKPAAAPKSVPHFKEPPAPVVEAVPNEVQKTTAEIDDLKTKFNEQLKRLQEEENLEEEAVIGVDSVKKMEADVKRDEAFLPPSDKPAEEKELASIQRDEAAADNELDEDREEVKATKNEIALSEKELAADEALVAAIEDTQNELDEADKSIIADQEEMAALEAKLHMDEKQENKERIHEAVDTEEIKTFSAVKPQTKATAANVKKLQADLAKTKKQLADLAKQITSEKAKEAKTESVEVDHEVLLKELHGLIKAQEDEESVPVAERLAKQAPAKKATAAAPKAKGKSAAAKK